MRVGGLRADRRMGGESEGNTVIEDGYVVSERNRNDIRMAMYYVGNQGPMGWFTAPRGLWNEIWGASWNTEHLVRQKRVGGGRR